MRKPPKYELVRRGEDEVIQDTANQRNHFFLASSGFGTTAETLGLAKKVVDFLNAEAEKTPSA